MTRADLRALDGVPRLPSCMFYRVSRRSAFRSDIVDVQVRRTLRPFGSVLLGERRVLLENYPSPEAALVTAATWAVHYADQAIQDRAARHTIDAFVGDHPPRVPLWRRLVNR